MDNQQNITSVDGASFAADNLGSTAPGNDDAGDGKQDSTSLAASTTGGDGDAGALAAAEHLLAASSGRSTFPSAAAHTEVSGSGTIAADPPLLAPDAGTAPAVLAAVPNDDGPGVIVAAAPSTGDESMTFGGPGVIGAAAPPAGDATVTAGGASAVISGAATVSPVTAGAGFGPETITLAGSGLVFDNTYSSSVTAAYRSAIIAAEHFYQTEYTNSVTLSMHFDFQSLGPNFAAENSFNTVDVSYSTLKSSLQSHALTPLQQAAVAALPATDPSGGDLFAVSIGMADILGIAGGATDTDNVTLNSDLSWTFGQDVIGAMEHEISEGAMGRIGSLGFAITPAEWAPMDLFRYSAVGTRDYTGGQDGKATFFSADGSTLSTQNFHNSVNASGQFDGFDLADWDNTIGDSFGPGGPGTGATLSTTDLQIMNVLGWDPTPPTLSAPNALTIGQNRTVRLPIAVTPVNAGDAISVTLSGIPNGVQLTDNAGSLAVTNGTITLNAAQLAGLSLFSTTATTGTITVAALDTSTGSANSTQQLFLRVDPLTNNTSTVTNTVTLTGGYYLYNSPLGLINVSGTAVLGTGTPNAVTNAGTIEGTGTAGIGIDLTSGGSVVNGPSGATPALISGGAFGITITGAAGTVANYGTVSSTPAGTTGAGVDLESGGIVVNGAFNSTAALISSTRNAVLVNGGVGTVENYGTIRSTGTNSTIYLGRGGLITNGASGSNAATIVGNRTAIGISSPTSTAGGVGTVVNFGTIQSNSTSTAGVGVYFGQGGMLTNEVGAVITSAQRGDITAKVGAGTVVNYGLIKTGSTLTAVYFGAGGTLTNQAGGVVLSVGGTPFAVKNAAGTVFNSGTIRSNASTTASSVYFGQGGVVTNQASGTISAAAGAAVVIKGGAGSVVNHGSISGPSGVSIGSTAGGAGSVFNDGTIAASFTSGFVSAINLSAGGTVTNQGTVIASGGTNGNGIAITGAGVVTNAAGALIAGPGNGIFDTFGTVINAGSISGTGIPQTGTMTPFTSGVNLTGGTVINTGRITALNAGGNGVNLASGGGSVSNGATNALSALIEGYQIGVQIGYSNFATGSFSGVGALTNDGTIIATGTNSTGANLVAGGNVVNGAPSVHGALIEGGQSGVGIGFNNGTIAGAIGTVVNYGSIISIGANGFGASVQLNAGGSVANFGTIIALGSNGTGANLNGVGQLSNAAGAVIEGAQSGVGIGSFNGTSASGIGTVSNLGTILSTGTGFSTAVNLRAGGSVTNGASNATAALIEGTGVGIQIGFNNGTSANGIGTVVNYGSIESSGTNSGGVSLQAGGNVTNAAGGLIDGPQFGVNIGVNNGASGLGAGTIANFGTILGAAGVNLQAGGSVINGGSGNTAALIEGVSQAVQIGFSNLFNGGTVVGGVGTVSNLGTILATGSSGGGVNLQGGGSVINGGPGFTTALIEGPGGGVQTGTFNGTIGGGVGTVANFGTILATVTAFAPGINLIAGGSVTNGGSGSAAALIEGAQQGVNIGFSNGTAFGGVGTVANFGTILATGTGFSTGVDLQAGGSLTNGASGSTAALIEGGQSGVVIGFNNGTLVSGAGTVANFGTIEATGTNSTGANLNSGGILTNGASGSTAALIAGSQAGVQVGFLNGTISSGPGTIVNYGRILSTNPGGFSVGIQLNTGGLIENFGTIGAGGTNGSGINATIGGTVINSGVVTVAGTSGVGINFGGGGLVINNSGGLISANEGVQLNGGTLDNFGTITGPGGNFAFFGSGTDVLVVEPGAVFNGSLGGFGTNPVDAIDFAQRTVTSVGFANGTLTAFNNGTIVSTLGVIGNFSPSQFSLASDNHGGTDVTLSGTSGPPAQQLTEAAPGSLGAPQNTPSPIPGFSVSDTNTTESVTTTLTAQHGVLSFGTAGLTGFTGLNTGSATLTGTVSEIDSALNTLEYDGNPGFSGADTVSLLSSDGTLTAGPLFTTINVGTSGPGQQLTEAVPPGPLSAAENVPQPLSGFSVTDSNTNEIVTTTLTAQHGVLSFGTAGLTGFTGLNTGSVTLSGTVSAINSALSTLEYDGNAGFTGSDTVSLQSTDGTLTAGPLFTSLTITSSGTTGSTIGHVLSGTYASGVVLSNPTTQNPATVTAAGYVTNSGTNFPGDGITAGTPGVGWTITNFGKIVDIGGSGIHLTTGGAVINEAGALISGAAGITSDLNATIVNSGTIIGNGTNGGAINLSGGTVINGPGGATAALIEGASGVLIGFNGTSSGGVGTVQNFATIIGTAGTGVLLTGGSVINGATGSTAALIEGTGGGIQIGNGIGTVSNFGTILNGVLLIDGGVVTNGVRTDTQAFISNVNFGGGFSTLANYGTINNFSTLGSGVFLGPGGGIVTNGASGSTAALIGAGIGIGFNGTLVGGTGTVINFGSIAAGGANSAIDLFFGGQVVNHGSVSGDIVTGYMGTGAATVFNDGVITGASNSGPAPAAGIALEAGGSVINLGTILSPGTGGYGVRLFTGGAVVNGAGTATTALIDAASGTGVSANGFATIVNYGTVLGGGTAFNSGVNLSAGGTVVNGASADTAALIEGPASGIQIGFNNGTTFGGIGTVSNFGTIESTGTGFAPAINLFGGGTVTSGASNSTVALIAGSQAGIQIGSFNGTLGTGVGTVVNFGTVLAIGTNSIAANLQGGGNVVNGASGSTAALIQGTAEGVQLGFNAGTFGAVLGTVSNFGTILATGTGGVGVNLPGGGLITNGGSGSTAALIRGVNDGVQIGFINGGTAASGVGTVVNFGAILASSTAFNAGVNLEAGGVVTNHGSISGQDGVNIGFFNNGTAASGPGTVFNDGVIAGTGGNGFVAGVQLVDGGTVTNLGTISATGTSGAAVNINSGAGAVFNGSATATQALITAGTGNQVGVSINGAAGTLVNFGTIAATGTSGSGVNFNGATLATLTNYGLIQAAGASSSAVVLGNGTVRNLGTIIDNAGGTLANDFGINIVNGGGATILNGATGATSALIEGYHIGVLAGGTSGVGSTVVNFGTVASTQAAFVTSGTNTNLIGVAVQLTAHGGSVANYGRITSNEQAISFNGGPGTLTNLGTIVAGGVVQGSTQQFSGVVMSAGGSVSNGASGSTSASIFDAANTAVVINGAPGSVTNFGTISTTTTTASAIYLQRSGLITNGAAGSTSALIEGRGGISFSKATATLSGVGTVVNFGSIIATGVSGGSGVYLGQGGIVTNETGAQITSVRNAINVVSLAGTLTNSGLIQNTGTNAAVYMRAGGIVTNTAGAMISSTRRGITFADTVTTTVSFGTVVNAGTILASGTGSVAAVYFGQGGFLTNQAGGTISGANGGVGLSGGGTVDNFGTIAGGNGTAVSFGAGNDVLVVELGGVFGGALAGFATGDTIDFAQETVTSVGFVNNTLTAFNNGTSLGTLGVIGTFTAGQFSLTSDGHGGTDVTLGMSSPPTITNSSTILSTVTLTGGSYLDNAASGVINAAGIGVRGINAPNMVANFGFIAGTGTGGVGVLLSSGSTVANFGTIVGQGGTAVGFAGGGNRVEISPTAVFSGIVNGGTGGDTLELLAGTGNLSGFGTQFIGFDTLQVDAGAAWSFAPATDNTGTFHLNLGGTLIADGNIVNDGTVAMNTTGPGGALEIAGTVFLVRGGTFALSDSSNNKIVSNGSPAELVNNRQVISGAGTIGDAQLTVINRSSGVIDANGTNPLVLAAATFGNTGLIEATGAARPSLVIITALSNTTGMDPGTTGSEFAGAGSQILLADGGSISSGAVTIAAGGNLSVAGAPASALVDMQIVNNGAVDIGTAGQGATLEIGGTVYLLQTGAVNLSDNAGTAIVSNGATAELINGHNTISGAGTIGDANLTVVNRSSAVIEATGVNPLTLTGAGVGNTGVIEAVGSGGLIVSGTTLSNMTTIDPNTPGGEVAESGSSISLAGATVSGGSIGTTLGGKLQIDSGAASTIANAFIVNDGSVAVGNVGQAGTLEIGGSVYLLRGGSLNLTDNAGSALISNGSTAMLTNNRGTITGAGTIGDANLSIVNHGFIEATGANRLTIAGAGIANDGVLMANGGMLVVTAPVTTPGTGSGRGFVEAGSTLDYAGSVASGQTAIFQGAGGHLVLDQSTNFHGKIAGFGGSDTIDLGDVLFNGTTAPSQVTQSGPDTMVTVTEGAANFTLDLLNQGAGVSYKLEADNRTPHAGTMLMIG